ncbi:bifunctional acetate--CoA ligase family protein/GNAT family N-acetyltransferase [Aliiroseovarius sp.]|uniref:bifunctional acetate--CoA ligase family protein/GNAT family N-acetyltransferase n=1 Tax=Aliiroseovarius sp. TaxID=1872442 RepID=UPI00261097D7|nr:bifunctional acetate--CoA ligase family protein/GNAT family N-acetyltransferase [Aliiroseovarius sp.]
MDVSPLNQLFNPSTIALFGASEKGPSVGAATWKNLISGGFKGTLIPINPHHKTLGDVKCHASVTDVPDEIDLAVIATPARTVPGIIRDCGEVGIRNVIVLSSGFGDGDGSGKDYEAQVMSAARRAGIRFLGPNCTGMVRPWLGLNATFLSGETPKGRLALVSQSSALISAIADWAGPHNAGFSALVSLGNSSDIGFGDALQFLATDPHTDAILLYVEGVRHAPRFLSALRHAARMKPVIVLKSGRHNRSAKAAVTHTGALIGSDEVFDAALERAGAVRAHTFGQLFAAAEILAATKKATGNRLTIISNGGGAGVLAADRAVDLGLTLPPLGEAQAKALGKSLAAHWSPANPVDILGDATPETYAAAVKATLECHDCDGVLVLLTPQALTDPTAVAKAVVEALPKRRKKPVLACWMGQSRVEEGRKLLSDAGVPEFLTPERAVEAFSYLAKHKRNRKLSLEIPGPIADAAQPDLDGAHMIIEAVLAEGRKVLTEMESKALLRAFNIPINTTFEATSSASALVAAESVGFPVAVKVNSPDISHKSDVGGVDVNIGDAADVKRAFKQVTDAARAARPDARILGVTVEPMAPLRDARELHVGATRDPVFGPTIMFGAGGTMVEVLKDSAVALPPLNEVLAGRLINRTRVSRLLDAFRERDPADRQAVVDVLLRVSDMVCELPEVVELDINPLIAGPDGVLAVDARVVVARPPARDGRYDHVAIHPYPRHLVKNTHLTDGTPLEIRPIRPEDAENEKTFVAELSDEARMFRFMGAMNELSPEMLVQFTQIDYRREMALVAMAELVPNEWTQLGVCRYVINPDDKTCEFAVVVSDKVQHQGIGTKLMKALFDAARQHGLDIMEGTVLRNNAPMLKLMKELGFVQRMDPDDRELVIVERWL